jgi:hypothetical protein
MDFLENSISDDSSLKYKNRDERKEEIITIMKKLHELGLNWNIPGIKEFNQKAIEFVNEGVGWSGTIKLRGTKRILVAALTPLKRIESNITLKYSEYV